MFDHSSSTSKEGMLRLQCLLSLDGVEEEGPSTQVVAMELSPEDRIAVLQTRIAEEVGAIQGVQAQPKTAMKLYGVQHQRLTYRQDPTTKREVLFHDGAEISGADARSGAVLRDSQQLVPWALVSWYFQDQQFAFPDAIDVVLVWEDEEEELG